MSITGLSIRKHTTVLVLVTFVIVMGLVSYITLPRESAPDIKIPFMIISTVYAGVAPSDMENLVTRHIEKELKGISGIKEILSSSSEGFSLISVEFEPEVNLDVALQKVKDKVDRAKPNLPIDAKEPVVTEINLENFPIITINLTADYDLVKLRKVAKDLADEFITIPGVLDAIVSGDLEREVQINIDPNRLKDYNLGLGDITEIIRNEHLTMPAGSMKIGDYEYTVRIPGELKDPDSFKDLVVTAKNNAPVYIRDLADVRYGFKDRTTIARLNGKPCISINVTKRVGENIIIITNEIKRILKEQEPRFPHGTHITFQNDSSKDIKIMVADLENNIISGLVLVVLCIFLFLGFTNSFFIGAAIPLSMFITFAVLQMIGITLNFVVLFSLVLAVGMLVDDAVVIVENIYRHRQQGEGREEGAEKATDEVAMAVSSSTVTKVVAFVPLLFWPGIIGEFMYYLPLTVVIALSASLFTALVMNPVFCSRWMKVNPKADNPFDPASKGPYARFLRQYEKIVTKAVEYPKITLGLALASLILTFVLFGALNKGVQFFPETDPDQMYINIQGPIGLRLDETDNMSQKLEKVAQSFPDATNVTANVGVSTASTGLTSGGSTANEGRIYIDFKDFEKRSRPTLTTYNESKDTIKFLAGADISLNKAEHGPPVGMPVDIQVSGDDYLRLGEIARDIRSKIKNVPGLVDLKDNFESSKPEIRITVDRDKAALLGLNSFDIAGAVRTAINGSEISKYREAEDEYDITVRFQEKFRSAIPDLDKIYIFKDEKQIPLSSVASFETAAGFGTIHRTEMKRVVSVTGQNLGRLPNDILNDVKKILAKYELPQGYIIKYSGADEEQQKAAAFLSKALLVALFLITMVLVAQFDSLRIPLIIMSGVILSFQGVMIGLMIHSMPFGVIMTGIGVITLAGVVVNNSIVLLDYTQKLRARGRSKAQAIIEAGKVRLRPVLLTAICTIMGLIPMATGWAFDFHTFTFSVSGSSSQWWAPMAIAVIYGLGIATILTLVIVPSMYMLYTKD
ncbi:MAG: efflux RND transporter permease subunit [Candidatus Latescibacter sp.]|nr:efflux RND transporter permease subunit [Candidatus Latescibacter sp.]